MPSAATIVVVASLAIGGYLFLKAIPKAHGEPFTPQPNWLNATLIWKLAIGAAIIYAGWQVVTAYYPPLSVTSAKSQAQRLSISIDPTDYDESKSVGAQAIIAQGYYTIEVQPGFENGRRREVVYNFDIPEGSIPAGKRLHLDFKLGVMKGLIGYRINQKIHKDIYLVEGGETRFHPKAEEFRSGKNEVAFFVTENQLSGDKFPLRLDGDRKITIAER